MDITVKKLWDWKVVRCTTDQVNCIKVSCDLSGCTKILESYGTDFHGKYSDEDAEDADGKETESLLPSLSGDIG